MTRDPRSQISHIPVKFAFNSENALWQVACLSEIQGKEVIGSVGIAET